MTDRTHDTSACDGLDRVAAAALRLVTDMRDGDPHVTLARVERICQTDPGLAARIAMCLAVWVPDSDTLGDLADRAERVAAGHATPVRATLGACRRCGTALTETNAVRNGRTSAGRQRWRCKQCLTQSRTAA